MKTTLCTFAAAFLLCGCNKPATTSDVPRKLEYKIVGFAGPEMGILEFKSNNIQAHLELRLAVNAEAFVSQTITADQLSDSNSTARGRCAAEFFAACSDLSSANQARFSDAISGGSKDGWELAATSPDPAIAGNTLLIFKRQKK